MDSKDDNENVIHTEDVENLLKLIAIDVAVESCDFIPGSNPGENYMSVVKRMRITGKNRVNNAGKFLWLFDRL